MVVEVLLAADQPLAIHRREEEAAVRVVAEQLHREQREAAALQEPAQLAGRDVQLVEAVRDVGVILEHSAVTRAVLAPAAKQAAVGRRQRAEHELGARTRRSHQLAATQAAPCLRERRNREPVPRSDSLVVAQRLGPLLALDEQPSARLLAQVAAEDEAPVLERLEQLAGNTVVLRPRIRETLDAVGVGVLCRGEATVWQT